MSCWTPSWRSCEDESEIESLNDYCQMLDSVGEDISAATTPFVALLRKICTPAPLAPGEKRHLPVRGGKCIFPEEGAPGEKQPAEEAEEVEAVEAVEVEADPPRKHGRPSVRPPPPTTPGTS